MPRIRIDEMAKRRKKRLRVVLLLERMLLKEERYLWRRIMTRAVEGCGLVMIRGETKDGWTYSRSIRLLRW